MKERLFKLCDELRNNGLKLTPARKIMLESLLCANDHLISALELFDQVRAKNKRINFSTVYRNLEVLIDCGMVQKLTFEGSAKYQLQGDNNHQHHLICTGCKKTEILPYCPLVSLEEAVKNNTDFLPMEHKVEIYGYCKECRSKKGY